MFNAEKNKYLIESIQKHDLDGYSLFYDTYAPVFYRNILNELYARDLAEAVLQNTFCSIWEEADRLDPSKDALLPWSMRILRKEIRKKKVAQVLQQIFACQRDSMSQAI